METIKIKGQIDFKLTRADGSVKEWSVNNLITSAGKAEIANLVGNVSTPTAFSYMAVGTSSTAVSASHTALQAEISSNGLSRASATVSRTTTTVTNDTLTFSKTFTVTGSSTIEEIGIFNASSSGTMIGRALTGSVSVVNGDQFQATYNVIFA